MSVTSSLALVLVAAVVAYGLRASFITGLAGRTVPPSVERGLSLIAPAVLAAMTVNFAFGGANGLVIDPAKVVALGVALGAAVWKRNLLLTLASGMTTLWVLTALSIFD